MRAIRDVNVPKFLQDDLKLFSGIVSDLFPKIRDVPVDYGDLEESIRSTSIRKGLEDVDGINIVLLHIVCALHIIRYGFLFTF